MRNLFRDIDGLLRGRFTRREDLLEGRIEVPVATLVKAGLLLGMVYGAFMGLFAVMRTGNPSFAQLAATVVKVPLLFLLTLVVTFPSLYVFSALSNSRLRHVDTLRLLLAAIGVNLALLASLGPVTGFFTLSTDSYPFMILLNVAFFATSGLVGLGFLRRALSDVFSHVPPPPLPASEEAGDEPVSPRLSPRPPTRSGHDTPDGGLRVFRVWTFIYAVVGAQMGWILRPFIGSPNMDFEFFRVRHSNFFQAVIDTVRDLLN